MVDWLADHIYHTTLGVIYLLKSKDAQTHRHSRWFLVPRTTVLGTATKVDNQKPATFVAGLNDYLMSFDLILAALPVL